MAINDRQQWGEYAYGDDFRTYERFGYPYGRYPYERFGYEGYGYEPGREMGPGKHTWRGGILGWLGAGIRAGAGWFGNTLQQWGTWFGGRVSGGTAEIGRAVRGRGEQMASALEDQDQRAAARLRRNPPPRYRRPDERILDDVWRRISLTAVDPQDVEIEVNGAVVTLSGRVSTRVEKRVIEDIADSVFGVREVQNHLGLARIGSESRGAETGPLATNAGSPATQRSFDTTVGETERH